MATGDFGGKLCIWDLERLAEPVFQSQAHASIINQAGGPGDSSRPPVAQRWRGVPSLSLSACFRSLQVDGCGGQAKGIGPPELATCGRDGCVRVWDVRQADAPVAAFEPTQGQQVRDAWCVALGDSYNDTERSLLAGYDNGDVKLFDLKMNKLRWETNVKNGVCGVEFDRRDIPMNKFMVCCLEAKLHCFDARTLHPSKGFASTTAQIDKGPTVWGSRTLVRARAAARALHYAVAWPAPGRRVCPSSRRPSSPNAQPQNREVVGVQGGDGTLYVYRYRYPDQRKVKDPDGVDMGVAGTLEVCGAAWRCELHARRGGFVTHDVRVAAAPAARQQQEPVNPAAGVAGLVAGQGGPVRHDVFRPVRARGHRHKDQDAGMTTARLAWGQRARELCS